MSGPIRAILWAQWRILLHFRSGGNLPSAALSGLILLGWFGLWTLVAAALGVLAAQPGARSMFEQALPGALFLACVLWQVVPLLMASQGASLELKKLLVYPIPASQLFGVDVALRVTSGLEMILLAAGLTVGLLGNPAVPLKVAPAVFALFVLFNLLLASGLRQQLERWVARRRLGEILVLLLVAASALPQLLMVTGAPAPVRRIGLVLEGAWWPWSAAAHLALGQSSAAAWLTLLAWTAAAWTYGRWQFARNLRCDWDAASAAGAPPARTGTRGDSIYGLFSRFLPDPLAALVEKELRSLVRSPRFRLVFIMGFTFGVVIFLPTMLRHGAGAISPHRLTMVSAYSLLILGDVVFWNVFGFDRGAAQLYFLTPSPFSMALAGKNVAAAIFVLLEVTGVGVVWALLRMPMNPDMLVEAYAVTLVLSLYLLGAGNLASVSYPRPVNPERSTGAVSSGRARVILLLAYPALALPVLLAYGAEYAFRSRPAFYVVLAFAAALGAAFYWVALGSAAAKSERCREQFLDTLSQSEGPVSLG
jgi:ABC-2 type transport system permease protein